MATSSVTYGFCHCGCGQQTAIAKNTIVEQGKIRQIKGQPSKYLPYHFRRTPKPIADRFWPKVDKAIHPLGCWIWTACKDKNGYGKIRERGTDNWAHRVSYRLAYGDIPNGLDVLHRCDNPSCVNPAHLFLGTHTDNMRDMMRKGRGNKARGDRSASRLHPESLPRGASHYYHTCPEKRLRGERHGMSKLNAEKVREIRKLLRLKVSRREIAERFNVREGTIGFVASGATWSHVQD